MRWLFPRAILALAGLLLAGHQAIGEDSLIVRTNYYRVGGESFREIRESMAIGKPKGLTHDAETVWRIEWKYTAQPGDAGCSLKALTLRTTITMTLPMWNGGTNGPAEVKDRWKQYMAALQKHEGRHRAFAEEAARAMRKELPGVRGPCSSFESAINGAANKILAEIKKKEAGYDLQTAHGIAEGARFP